MNSSYPDALKATIDGYLRFFETTGAFGALLFAAASFLLLRRFGLIRDDSLLASFPRTSLIVVVGTCAIVVIFVGFIAQNVTLSFHYELLKGEAYAGCNIPSDARPDTFFLECHRETLRNLVWISLSTTLIGVLALSVWLGLLLRRPRT